MIVLSEARVEQMRADRPHRLERALRPADVVGAPLLLPQCPAGRGRHGLHRRHHVRRRRPGHHLHRSGRHRRFPAGGPGDRGLPSGPGPQPPGRAHRGTGAFRRPTRASSDGSSRRCGTPSDGGPWPTRVIKMPLTVFGVWFAFSVWVDAFFCLTYPLWGTGAASPQELRLRQQRLPAGLSLGGNVGFLPRILHLGHRRDPLLRGPLDHAARRLHRPSTHAGPAGPRRHDGAGALARARPGPDPRHLGGHAAPDRTRPPRRDPGAAGGGGHASRSGEGETGRRQRRLRPRPGAPTGRRRPQRGQGGHRRAA